jgi:type II secretory pathway pseudopilin PulG
MMPPASAGFRWTSLPHGQKWPLDKAFHHCHLIGQTWPVLWSGICSSVERLSSAKSAERKMRRKAMIANLLKKISHAGKQAGFTVAEAATVLSAAAILAGSAAPVVSEYIESARLTRTKHDLMVLGSAIQMYRVDTASNGFIQRGKIASGKKDMTTTVKMLVTNGDIPQMGPGGAAEWALPVDTQAVDTFQDHLITNTVGYTTSAGRTTGFAQASQGGFNAPYAWRGPYLNAPIDSDPWGNRYACNVLYLMPANANDVIVLSAGPDQAINSPFTKDGLVAEGDDIIYIVSGGR